VRQPGLVSLINLRRMSAVSSRLLTVRLGELQRAGVPCRHGRCSLHILRTATLKLSCPIFIRQLGIYARRWRGEIMDRSEYYFPQMK